MASVCKLTAKEVAMTDTKIEIRNLYKVFGNNPEAVSYTHLTLPTILLV